jgi:hypothetical protein
MVAHVIWYVWTQAELDSAFYRLDQVFTNKVKNSKYTACSSIFNAEFVLSKRGRLLRVICQLYVVRNWPSKPQKCWMKILFYFLFMHVYNH